MKKFLVILLSGLFVFGIAATAFAVMAEIPAETQAVVAKGATQVTLGGNIRIRGEMRENVADLNSDTGFTSSSYDHRVRLNVDAVLEKVTGRIAIEGASSTTSDVYTVGSGSAATGVYPMGNAKRGSFSILESWMQYKGDAVGLKAGHMPLALGNKLFFDHTKFGDDAVVLFMDPSKEVHVGLLTIKLNEQSSETVGNAADADAYVGLVTLKSAPVNVSADITYVIDGAYYIDNTGTALANADGTKLWNIGLRGDIKADMLTIKADLELQSGSAEKAVSATEDMDYKGSAILLGASLKADPVTVGLEFGRGSGNDTGTAKKYEGFITSLSGGTPYPAFVYGPRVLTACAVSGTDTNTGICNTQYVKASVGTKIDKIGVNADLLWLTAVEEVAIMSAAQPKSDDLGIELDAKATYALAKNLNYWVEGGYFMPGDAYKLASGQDPDNAYAIRHGLELSF